LGEKIGEGGFGVIYLAEWNNQKYAIKRFKFYDVKKEDVIKEAEVLMYDTISYYNSKLIILGD
jgi:predicted Ser/Thr protein kinase